MRKYFSLVVSLVFPLYLLAQIHEEAGRSCREKCHFISGTPGEQRVTYFQYPTMDKYDVKYIKLDLSVEANNRNIAGTALTRARVVQPLDSFVAELRNAMIIDSIFINGTKITGFTESADHVFVPVSPALPVGSTVTALFYYRGLANSSGVIAGSSSSTGLNYTATLSESYQGREWFPVKQILKDKIDSADIWITTSNTNLAGSNGLLTGTVDLPNNKRQYQWKTRYPMAYYLASFSVGNYMEYKNYAKPPTIFPDSILVQHYIVNNATYFNTNKPQLDKTPIFIENMSEFIGLYPFHNEKYGHAHANIGGGMEHQTMSTMSSFGTSLISHELAHQWWGDNVTCATWNHIWLNEGFASYMEHLMIEHLPALHSITPAAHMLGVHTNVLSSPGGSVFVPDASIYDENRIFSGRLSYDKGSAIIHNLRFEIQNDNVFFQVLRNFQQQFGDSVATADDFKNVAETTCARSFADFFSQWYYGEGYPTFNIDYYKLNDSIVLTLNQTVSMPSVTPFFKGLYEVTIKTVQGDTIVKVNQTFNNQVFKFRSTRTPNGIVFDPNNWVLNKVGSITTGINDPINVSNDVNLFPNPSSGTFYLQYPSNWFHDLQMFDVAGKLLQQEKIAAASTQKTVVTSLLPGTYIIRLNGKGKIAAKKLVIIP
jgi:aminopeptidase N